MKSITIWLYRFCLWQMRFEYSIGRSTGMNPSYLNSLSVAINDMELDLQQLEWNH